MITSFSRTLRTLSSDRPSFSIAAAAITVVLLGGWASWMTLGRVTLIEATENARLEVATSTSPVQSSVSGRVVRSSLALGRLVRQGDILVELDAEAQRLELREQAARLAGLAAESEPLRAQMQAEENTRVEDRRSATVAAEQARAMEREALAPARFSTEEFERLSELRRLGLVSEREYTRGKAEAEKHRAGAASSRIAIQRIEQEQRAKDSDRGARILRLKSEITAIDGRMQALRANVERLSYEVERRLIRAPSDGRIGQAQELRPGSVIGQGDQLAAIVPDGRLRIVAHYAPIAAMGRLRTGQTARMRMHGYPWAQYGFLNAKISHVADEVRDGMVRVELAPLGSSTFHASLQHGMPGSLEVEVESIAPAALALRLAGQRFTRPLDTRASAAVPLN